MTGGFQAGEGPATRPGGLHQAALPGPPAAGRTTWGRGQCSAEDARRKHALEIMSMPRRYSANARLLRVARICSNQVQRMSSYLRGRPSSGPTRYETAWDLMPPYDPEQEGT